MILTLTFSGVDTTKFEFHIDKCVTYLAGTLTLCLYQEQSYYLHQVCKIEPNKANNVVAFIQ